ncbi:uncharacterized protein LOC132746101 isoform X2 [Ruditapes philippinarum]|uniref:uncharacterized protein LOC132746101 isoform X2 n=1 Tax=Ruditapes philippinarum TaxID=129788 RepID=UPI00295B4C83|nr:uncharacterized protein LOC132746101 isoform X2 [Ruditapes philippinarum]
MKYRFIFSCKLLTVALVSSILGCILLQELAQLTPSSKVMKMDQLNVKRRFVEISSQGTYIYSAFFNQDKINRNEEKTIVVLSWQQENATINRYKCCVVANNEMLSLQSSKTNYFVRGYGRLYASRVECHVPPRIISIDYVSIVKQIDECPTERTFYITVTVRKQITNRPNLAICNKYLYGSIDAFQLIEWFEVNLFHGVDTFTIHYNPSLNELSKRVLRYYENKGILQAVELIPPLENEISRKAHTFQLFKDEHVALLDCRERHRYFDITIDIDRDEFIVMNTSEKGLLKKYLVDKLLYRKIGVLKFYIVFHDMTWNATNYNHELMIGRYGEATLPIIDWIKNAYMPSRVRLESGTIHAVLPMKGVFANPEEIALHHFRKCRTDFNKAQIKAVYIKGRIFKMKQSCKTMPRHYYKSIEMLANEREIQFNVHQVIKSITQTRL